MIQGGGYGTDHKEKRQELHKPITNEAKNGLKNKRGTIAMARTPQPHSATAQFFINVVDNAFLDYPGRDGWGYCVFGKVVEGMDIVNQIRDTPTQPNTAIRGAPPCPVKAVVIKKAQRVKTETEGKEESKEEPKKDTDTKKKPGDEGG